MNSLAGLAMLIIGLFLMIFGYLEYGAAPIVVGLALVLYYRRYLLELMGV